MSHEAPVGTETVLVVEDDEAVRRLTREILQRSGYRVFDAGNPREAIQVAGECATSIDLLLTDVVMPDVNGRVLAERLGAMFPSLRVLFMSGYSDEAVFRHGMIRPDTAFIEKPFTEDSLARKVREVLDA